MTNFHHSVTALFVASLLLVGGCKPEDAASSEAALVPAADAAPVSVHAQTATAPPQPAATTPACTNCGKVTTITPVTVKGEGTGLGAAVGAIVGGLAGNQVGGGSGKRIATVIGVAGGAVAGNAIERNRNADRYFDIGVVMEDGSSRTISVDDASALAVGTAVIVEGDNLRLR